MNKTLKILLNILILLLIAGFGYYMVHSIISEDKTTPAEVEKRDSTFISPYKKITGFDAAANIICFDIHENMIYAALSDKVSVFDISGAHQHDFPIRSNIRDIVVDDSGIYLLFPAGIDYYALDGQKIDKWEACSDNSDYCSFATTKDYIFVTDAGNKNICQYDKQGGFIRFIDSPEGFIIPSYSFDIININDTLYCSNSGRHKIESYTTDGTFIASFGKTGTQAGAFVGCCNPTYLAKSSDGNILTSEKGIPRISCYGKDGKFRTILFDSHSLGGGTTAYEMQVSEGNIYIASEKTISIYRFDPTLSEKSCAGCEADCPLRKNVE